MKGTKTARRNCVALYRVRLKIAAVLNILEMIGVAASITRPELLEKGKPERHIPFKNLLFGLVVRCESSLEGVSSYTSQIKAGGVLSEGELSELEIAISAKHKQVSKAMRFLEEGKLATALSKLAESRTEIKEIAEKLDAKIEGRLK